MTIYSDATPSPRKNVEGLSGAAFQAISIASASSEDIRSWSRGEVTKPETINYRTLTPEKDGLFDERIFGPTKDWECRCGKYKRSRFKGVVCERCGVEVTRARVRRERMGHIELAAPVSHIWYFKGVPSQLGHALGMMPKHLEQVLYFGAYVITRVDVEALNEDVSSLEAELSVEREQLIRARDAALNARAVEFEEMLSAAEKAGEATPASARTRFEKDQTRTRERFDAEAERMQSAFDLLREIKPKQIISDEQLYQELRIRFGVYFEGGMGAAAIRELLVDLDVPSEIKALEEIVQNGKGQKRTQAIKRLKVLSAFHGANLSPANMILDVVPVIPPDLRPMVQLDGGRFATSDLNDLYRRVINRNNRLRRLVDLGAPDVIVNNEKRMLQEAVDSLFDNGRRGRPVTGPNGRALKSLSDMLKGKSGRFRQNLLGKRVDYSGRSVIVVGPQLKLHQCGLPKGMALELFKPFVMERLVSSDRVQNIKAAKRAVERQRSIVWDILEEVIQDQAVLLNRAPTLHRLGIQAFEPVLVEGKAIQIHPLVCTAFNADFDGDQMAVHLPLSVEAQAEARILMLASNNILSPASGRPITAPTQDMIIGAFYLTQEYQDSGRVFGTLEEAVLARDFGHIDLQNRIQLRVTRPLRSEDTENARNLGEKGNLISTTLGRALFNEALPAEFPYVNHPVSKKELGRIISLLVEDYPTHKVAETLDALKELGFYWATRSGVSIGISDVETPSSKPEILDRYEKEAARVETQYGRGFLTSQERRTELISIWTRATDEVSAAMEKNFSERNPVYMMVGSGARGNMMQMRQIAGMRGLVANPKGEIIARPIKSNYREGLSVLEYFSATHGARKGLADTALRTADSGYLTRRLVDVSQDVIVREQDCGTNRALLYPLLDEKAAVRTISPTLEDSLVSRLLGADVSVGESVIAKNTPLTLTLLQRMFDAGIDEIRARTPLTCQAPSGACALCYGLSLATASLVEVGEAVGIIAAQSIGEPGTQLTMRTFHTGGAVGDDITQGLPRVVELFEARTPKGVAPIAEGQGILHIEDTARLRRLTVTGEDGEEYVYQVPLRVHLLFQEGDSVEVGDQLTSGAVDPHEVLRIRGPRAVQNFIVDEVQRVYRSQGVAIHNKHIEVIVRQMLSRLSVLDSGETPLLTGSLVQRSVLEEASRTAVLESKAPASGRPVLMGITKASLATDSWLSAASFQETTRILTQAAVAGKKDMLVGLKENVIIGNLIPAGTGLARYQKLQVNPPRELTAPQEDILAEATSTELTFSEPGEVE